MEYMLYFLLAIIGLFLLIKVFSWPLKIIWKLIVNGLLGAIILIVLNLIGRYFNFYIAINAVTALIVGFLGIPGVIFLVIFKLIL